MPPSSFLFFSLYLHSMLVLAALIPKFRETCNTCGSSICATSCACLYLHLHLLHGHACAGRLLLTALPSFSVFCLLWLRRLPRHYALALGGGRARRTAGGGAGLQPPPRHLLLPWRRLLAQPAASRYSAAPFAAAAAAPLSALLGQVLYLYAHCSFCYACAVHLSLQLPPPLTSPSSPSSLTFSAAWPLPTSSCLPCRSMASI